MSTEPTVLGIPSSTSFLSSDPLGNFRARKLNAAEQANADERTIAVAEAKNAQAMAQALIDQSLGDLKELEAEWQIAGATPNFAEIFDAEFFQAFQRHKAALKAAYYPLINYKNGMHSYELEWESGQPVSMKKPELDPAVVASVLNAGN